MINENTLMRGGIPIEKGVALTKDFLNENQSLFTKYLEYWLLYPDAFLDSIKKSDDNYFNLFPFQRIALRAAIRYRYHSFTATRATSKSFTIFLASVLRCIFLPGTKVIVVADVKGTVIKVATDKLNEIWQHWPLLHNELKTRTGDGVQGEKKSSDYFELEFKNNSKMFVISKDSSRGIRGNSAIIEESATMEETAYNEVVLPILNIPRKEVDGSLNPNEPHSPQSFVTTAGPKTCFMYRKLIELAAMSIIRPDEYFIWGLDYKVPVKYGLLNKKQMDEQRLSNTISSDSFARESLSIWTGTSEDALFDYKTLNRRRTLLKCERAPSNSKDCYYIISMDIARYLVNSVICVFKVIPRQDVFKKNLVYMEVIHGANFITEQAPRLKELIKIYKPKEVVVDINGIGGGMMDAIVTPSTNPVTGEVYPPYYAFNDEDYLPPSCRNPREEPMPEQNAIIYGLKANGTNNGFIHANAFAQIGNGSVSFLASEQVAKDKIMATKKGQKMDHYSLRKFLLPYEMTSRLIDEMNNLRLKPTAAQGKMDVEQISKSIPKDRWSSMEYGLWRIKYYEDKAIRKAKNRGDSNKYAFFTPRKRR